MKIEPYGESALYVDLEIPGSFDRAERTQAVARALRARLPEVEVVLGAGTLAIVGVGAWDDVEPIVTDALRAPLPERRPVRVHEIFVIYDGVDLPEVASLVGTSVGEVAKLHGSRAYTVELVGFLPGFAYLSPLDARLVVPRRGAPRPRVDAMTVAIAGSYTAIYPMASPGGWRLIGRAVGITLFDGQRDPPALFQPGDRVRFVAQGG